MGDLIQETLEVLEKSGGSAAFVLIKNMVRALLLLIMRNHNKYIIVIGAHLRVVCLEMNENTF